MWCKKGVVAQEGKTSLKIEFLGRIFLGHQGPTHRDIPAPSLGMSRTKTLCKAPFSVALDKEWPGCLRRCPSTVSCTVPSGENPFSVDSQLRAQLRKQPRFGGVQSTGQEVVRVRFCCLLKMSPKPQGNFNIRKKKRVNPGKC